MSSENTGAELSEYQKLRLIVGEYITVMSPIFHGPSFLEMRNFKVGCAGMTYPIENVSPAINMCDGPNGLRIGISMFVKNKTAFPTGMCLAATFDTKLAELEGEAIGAECVEENIGVLLGPAINICRHPLAGRNYECFSEDPRVAGEIGAYYIKGIQNNGISACVKHFIANNQETSREYVDVKMSERAFREIYLEPFRIAIEEGKPMALMTSYNKINGEYAGERREFYEVLREELHYDGIIMTDWYACKDTVKMVLMGNNLIELGV
ncbi:thermostable beta-glucosidase, partial [Entamoeba invadens IP1]